MSKGGTRGNAADFLVEVGTEELPPKALARLGKAFGDALHAGLARDGLLDDGSAMRWFATPRRLAVHVSAVRERATDRKVEIQGPSVKAGRDAEGRPTPALQGFARKNGVATDALEEIDTPEFWAFLEKAVRGFFKFTDRGIVDTEARALLPTLVP